MVRKSEKKSPVWETVKYYFELTTTTKKGLGKWCFQTDLQQV
jgi:hypothetical protein